MFFFTAPFTNVVSNVYKSITFPIINKYANIIYIYIFYNHVKVIKVNNIYPDHELFKPQILTRDGFRLR